MLRYVGHIVQRTTRWWVSMQQTKRRLQQTTMQTQQQQFVWGTPGCFFSLRTCLELNDSSQAVTQQWACNARMDTAPFGIQMTSFMARSEAFKNATFFTASCVLLSIDANKNILSALQQHRLCTYCTTGLKDKQHTCMYSAFLAHCLHVPVLQKLCQVCCSNEICSKANMCTHLLAACMESQDKSAFSKHWQAIYNHNYLCCFCAGGALPQTGCCHCYLLTCASACLQSFEARKSSLYKENHNRPVCSWCICFAATVSWQDS